MRSRQLAGFLFCLSFALTASLWAQDLGPGFTMVKDGIYVYASKEGNSTCSVILTQEGVVLIDSCQTPMDAYKLLAGVKKLTDKPVRFLIDTETHSDHTFGHFRFLAARDGDRRPRGHGGNEKRHRSEARRHARSAIPRDA